LTGIFILKGGDTMQKRIIRKPELFAKIGLSDATIWRMERSGRFPQRIQLGGNSVGWFDTEIDEWLVRKSTDRISKAG
jgi:prophage regulatory protein